MVHVMMGSAFVVIMIAVAVTIVILVLVPAVVAVLRVARRHAQADASPLRNDEAVVLDKRTHIEAVERGPAGQRYYVTFQFNDGRRVELEVSGPESGLLVVGDHGTLAWRGPRYLGFTREIMR